MSDSVNTKPPIVLQTQDSEASNQNDMQLSSAAGTSSANTAQIDLKNDSSNADVLKKNKRGGRKVREKKERIARRMAQDASRKIDSSLEQQQTSSNAEKLYARKTDIEISIVARQMQHAKSTSTPNKRSLARGETPPDLSQAPKKGKKSQPAQKRIQKQQLNKAVTMAQAVSDAHLLLAVVDMPVPDVVVPLTRERYDAIYKAIDSFVFKMLESDNNDHIPKFDDNVFTRGVMKIRCSTPATKTWLSTALQHFPNLWKDMKLNVINFADLPTPKKVLGLFKNCTLTDERIIFALGRQNEQINVECWTILSRTASDSGTHIVFGISEDQLVALQSLKFALHFGAGIAKFKDISKKPKSDQSQPTGAMEMEVGDQTEDDVNNATIVPETDTVTNTGDTAQQKEQINQNQNSSSQTAQSLNDNADNSMSVDDDPNAPT